MDDNRRVTFAEGGLWEESEWTLEFGYQLEPPETPCRHCQSGGKQYSEDRMKWMDVWVCPRVIIARNEGGHNSTGLCYDCVKEGVESTPGKA